MTETPPPTADLIQQAREHGMLLYKAFVLQLCEEYCSRQDPSSKYLNQGLERHAIDLYQHIKDSICKSF